LTVLPPLTLLNSKKQQPEGAARLRPLRWIGFSCEIG
jgi:hypothetical protein